MAALVVGLCAASLAPLACEAYVVPGSFPRDYTLGQDLEGESVVFAGELSLVLLWWFMGDMSPPFSHCIDSESRPRDRDLTL